MLNDFLRSFEPNADEVIEIAIWESLDIQIHRRAVQIQFRAADDVDFALPNRESFQRVMILSALLREAFWLSAWPEGVRELGDSEYTPAVECSSLLLSHARQQAEVVFLNRLLAASRLKLACSHNADSKPGREAMAGKQRGNFPG